jgi:hypothetical protein
VIILFLAVVLQPNEAVLSSAEDGEDQQLMILNEYRHLEENHLNADGTQPCKYGILSKSGSPKTT